MVTKLIILGVIVLAVVAVAQLMRVYELSSKLRNKVESEISQRDNNFNARMMLLMMIILFGGFIWLMFEYGWVGRGSSASVHGHELDWLLNLNLIIITAVFFLCNTLLFVFAYKYVKKPGVKALYYPHNNKLEMLWTVVPACVLAVIIILGLKSWNDATSEAAPESIRVELFSKQFDWTARYSGDDNKLGKFDYKLTTSNNELALMTTNTIDSAIAGMEARILDLEDILNRCDTMLVPENKQTMINELSRKERMIRSLHQMRERYDAKDDALAWLYLCKNKEYEFVFRSKDVIHSAYFPHFRAQMNTVPGMTTRFKFIPDKSTDEMRVEKNNENFNYILMCNKICGGAHYKMKMMVVVLEEKEYNEWMDSKQNMTFKDNYFAKAAASEEVEEAEEGDLEGENEDENGEEGNEEVAEAPEETEA
jgi:cytochrome c oxidase subunit 2